MRTLCCYWSLFIYNCRSSLKNVTSPHNLSTFQPTTYQPIPYHPTTYHPTTYQPIALSTYHPTTYQPINLSPINLSLTTSLLLPYLIFFHQLFQYIIQYTIYKLSALRRTVLFGYIYIFVYRNLCWYGGEVHKLAHAHP